jgi:hypothetical protein
VPRLRRVWRTLKGAARFYLDYLMQEPSHGWLVPGPDTNFEKSLRKLSAKVTGLRARGGLAVDIEWQDGKVTACRLSAKESRPVELRINGQTNSLTAKRFDP